MFEAILGYAAYQLDAEGILNGSKELYPSRGGTSDISACIDAVTVEEGQGMGFLPG